MEMEMIIDARNFVGTEYGRQGSVKGVINHAIDGIEVGKHIRVEAMTDVTGKAVPWERLSMYVSTLKGDDRKFTIRKSINGVGYEVHRIA